MKKKSWKYCEYSQTVRQMPENYCLFSAKTFATGGTYDAAALPEAEKNLKLAAAAPELLEALEILKKEIGIWWSGSIPKPVADAALRANIVIAKAKGDLK